MAMARSITITTAIKEDGKEAGAVSGHRVEARVEVGVRSASTTSTASIPR
jgi:hypothetical protein